MPQPRLDPPPLGPLSPIRFSVSLGRALPARVKVPASCVVRCFCTLLCFLKNKKQTTARPVNLPVACVRKCALLRASCVGRRTPGALLCACCACK